MNDKADSRIDARPVRPISTGTAWDKAMARRDEIAAAVRSTMQNENVLAAVVESANGNYPPWVKLEAWLPGPTGKPDGDVDGRERAELEIIVEVKPYHEHETVVRAKAKRGKNDIAITARPAFAANDAAEWTRFALGRSGRKPSSYKPGFDALQTLVHSLIPLIPEPHRNRIDKEFKSRWSGAGFLGAGGLALLFIGFQLAAGSRRGLPPEAVLTMLAGISALICAFIWARRRQQRISVAAQPVEVPRVHLALVDSWHAVISDIGVDFGAVKTRLVRAIATGSEAVGITCRSEIYTHTLPNGYEQRERLVVSKDQGMVHVHVYAYGNDVFVGWQAFLNWSRWGETAAVSKRVREGSEVEYRDVTPTVYVPNQFDLIDLSSLSEFVHRRLEREIRTLLKEKSIDQEVDFKIIRGDRDRALDQSRHNTEGRQQPSGWSYKAT